ncbi:MAG: biotin--[acetyl-CoA-carboxylase] ligase, partial [Geodermatophilaceae bacterium]
MPEPAELSAVRGRLDARAVREELRRRGSGWPAAGFASTVESTNFQVADAARKGEPEGFVLVAEEQTSGRGRLDRSWSSPRGAGLTLSVLLRPAPPRGTWGWLPILAGLATLDAVRTLSDVDAALKWPNDLLLGPGQAKAAGILAVSGDRAVVLGVGLNVSTTAEELPLGATSLLLEGAVLSREQLLVELVLALESRYVAWTGAAGDAEASAVLSDYRAACAT